jgi:hypothetical protein
MAWPVQPWGSMRTRKARPQRPNAYAIINTERLLALHEKFFAPLDPKSRRRILTTARVNGWDRGWGEPVELVG